MVEVKKKKEPGDCWTMRRFQENKAKTPDEDDRSRLQDMKINELRAMMREVGIPVKGSKQDLVTALESFLKTEDEGSKNPSSKRKADDSYSNDFVNETTECHRLPQKIVERNEKTSTKNSTSSTIRKSLKTEKKSAGPVESEPWTILTHMKPMVRWVAYNPKIMRSPPLASDVKSFKVMSWNVNGLRALLKSVPSPALQLAQREDFDVLCLQETKIQEKDVDKIKKSLIDGYGNSFWSCSNSKLGYSGTAIISRIKPITVSYGLGIIDHDSEGRLLTVEFDKFYLICGYVPNSGDGLKRLDYRINEWDTSLSKHVKNLEKLKPVILTGDLNCAHEEIDIHNPAGNRRSAGFTEEERQSFHKNFLSKGLVDTFRNQHPCAVGYTYYGYRSGARKTNKGWRLDYFLVSESISDRVHDSYILPDISGSDHCPIGLILKL